MKPAFTVSLKIRKPAAEVFDAVVDDKKMSGYFIAEATGPLVAGQTVQWKFPEFDEFFPVKVIEITAPERIVLAWQAADGDYDTHIEMSFKPLDASNTMVSISESGWRETAAGFKAAFGNAPGWMHMMCGLKASLEYGINLREGGAF
ncbi:MAG: ATPase [Caulobacterales bacterium 68-7]|nr:SRPBCC domain-containing protein [Caulobacterales bacterium]OJU14128.1 MAG: ATPase [Caulobacterales bacterium 68-7]